MQKSRTIKAKSAKSARKKARAMKSKSERVIEEVTPEEIARQKKYESRQRQSQKPVAVASRRKSITSEEEDRQADELLLQIWQKVYDRHHPVAQPE